MHSLMTLRYITLLRRAVLAVLVSQAVMLPRAALAVTDTDARIAKLERMVATLTARLNQLEAERSDKRPVDQPAAQDSSKRDAQIESLQRDVSQLTVGLSKRNADSSGIPLHGFADVGLGFSNKQQNYVGERPNGFAIGSFDMYLTPQLGDRVKSLVEVNVERSDSGEVNIDLERLQMGYVFNDDLTAWLGRFHTPYGVWNTAYHHGAQIQTSILRPRFLAFEDQGGILPAHTVGLWAKGGAHAGDGKISYDLYLGNGSRINVDTLDMNNAKDDNNNRAVGFNVGYKFGSVLSGLTVGAHGLTEEVDSYDANSALVNRTRMAFYGGYTAYDANDWDMIGEYYNFHDKDLSGGTGAHASWAGFMQIGRLMLDRWTPYVRFEKAVLDQGDNYFLSQISGRSYVREALGMRYDLEPKSALKFEADHTEQKDNSGPNYHEMRIQYSIRF